MKIKLKPARPGLKVPFPMSKRYLLEDGESVEKSSYWCRRMAEGDAVECKEDSKKEPIKAPKKEVEPKIKKSKASKVSKKNKSETMEDQS